MNQETKDKLRLIPKTVCFKCRSIRSYKNPMGRCYECKNKFCYDHLHSLQFKEGMSQSEELRSLCEKCKITHNYQTL